MLSAARRACSWSRWVTRARCRAGSPPPLHGLLDGVAGAAAQRAQVRPGASGCRWCWAWPGCCDAARRARRPRTGPRRPARGAPGSSGRSNQVVAGSRGARSWSAAALPAARRPRRARRPVLGDPRLLDADRRLARASSPATGTALLAARVGVRRLRLGRAARTSRCSTSPSSRWAVRNAIPLAPAGQHPDARRHRGAARPGRRLARPAPPYLRRAGVRLPGGPQRPRALGDVPDPVLVHQALDRLTRAVARVATLRPAGRRRRAPRQGRRPACWSAAAGRPVYPAVEVYEVRRRRQPPPSAHRDPPVVVGGPEDLLDLPDLGVLGERSRRGSPSDAPRPTASRRAASCSPTGCGPRERFFGRIHDGDVRRPHPRGRAHVRATRCRDYLLDEGGPLVDDRPARRGAAVSASSSMSDSDAAGRHRAGARCPTPRSTATPRPRGVSGLGTSGRAWWRDRPRARRLAGPRDGDRRAGRARARRQSGCAPRTGSPSASRSTRARPGCPAAARRSDLAAARRGGVARGRPTAVPRRGRRSRRAGHRSAGAAPRCRPRGGRRTRSCCAPTATRVPAVPAWTATCDVSRVATARARRPRAAPGRDPRPAGRPTAAADDRGPVPGEALDDLVLRDQPVARQVSSVAVPDERAVRWAAIDGDPGTTWTAARADLRPSLTLSWLGVHRVRGIRLLTDANSAARQPTRVSLTWPGGRRVVTLDAHGRARFRPFRDRPRADARRESAPVSAWVSMPNASDLGVGITELRLRGVPYLPLKLSSDPARLRCGSGPRIIVGGRAAADGGARVVAAAGPGAAGGGAALRRDHRTVRAEVVARRGRERDQRPRVRRLRPGHPAPPGAPRGAGSSADRVGHRPRRPGAAHGTSRHR